MVAPVIPLAFVALPVAALGVAVLAHVEEQRAAAAEREKARLEIWQRHLVEQSRAMQQLDDEWQALESLREDLGKRSLAEPSLGNEGEAHGRVTRPRPHRHPAEEEQMRVVLAQVEKHLSDLPPALSELRGAPFQRLLEQAREWLARLEDGYRPTAADHAAVLSFRETVTRTVARWSEDLEKAARGKRRLFERTEQLLDEVLYCMQQDEGDDTELRDIWHRLNTLLRDGDITAGTLEWMEQRLAVLKANMEQGLPHQLVRSALQARLCHHLGELGYQVLDDFPETAGSDPARAILQIPGGEYVEATVHPDGGMAFVVRHQRPTGALSPLSEAEREHFRTQEAIWCRDMKDLVRRLVEEGWPLEIPFERKIPAGSIAVLETPDDWGHTPDLENEDDRRLFKKTPRRKRLS